MKIADGESMLFTGDSITDCGRARPVGEGGGPGNCYVSLVAALLCAAVVIAPRVSSAAKATTNDIIQAYEGMDRLTEVMLQVRQHYAREQSYEEIVSGAINGMLQSLDPHSCYMEPRAYDDMREETSGRYSGIGIHIGMKNSMLTVIAPIEDTPGFRAGLLAGDRIVGIDGEKTLGLNLRDAVKRLRGEKGSEVLLTIERLDDEESREVKIVRDNIKVPSVKGARLLDGNVGYVRITQFSAPTADTLRKEIDGLVTEGMRALVLDLRSNPGGLLDAAVRVSEQFLEKGDLVVTVKGRADERANVPKVAAGNTRYTDFPMVVLVNKGSASASEIVAGALRDSGRAVLIGDTTYGKGSVQSVIPLRSMEGAAIRLTTAHYHTPSGAMIHETGIEPDIRVYVSPEEWRKVRIKRSYAEGAGYLDEEEAKEYADVVDRQLQRAVDLLRAILVFRTDGSRP